MDDTDPISEIELLSRNFLSQDSNLDEYDDVDTAILSPRRPPVDHNTENKILNVAAKEDDDQSDSSGFSSSIPKTVQDIDGVLNEIRLRSSPDPDDLVFRSGNYQYDDDVMTEKSYQTNSNLFLELNKAHESFMKSFEDGLELLGHHSSITDGRNDGDDHPRLDSTFDLSWLRSRVIAANERYDRKRIRYEHNHIDTYENNHVHSPDKNQLLGDACNGQRISPAVTSKSCLDHPLEVRQNSYPEANWNELSYSEEDVEDILSRVNRSYRTNLSQETEPDRSGFGSKLTSVWSRIRSTKRYQRQLQDNGREGILREETYASYTYSRKLMRMYLVAIGCSMMAMLFVVVGLILMGTFTHLTNAEQSQSETAIIAEITSWMDSNNTIGSSNNSQIESSVIFVDGELEQTTDSPSTLPVTPPTSGAPSAPPTEDSVIAPSASEIETSSLSRGPLPISGAKETDLNYVSSNVKPPTSGTSDNHDYQEEPEEESVLYKPTNQKEASTIPPSQTPTQVLPKYKKGKKMKSKSMGRDRKQRRLKN